MSAHPRAERWADLAAGRLDEGTRRELIAHAEACASCRAARARVDAARSTLASLRQADAPDLPWEGMGARIKWTISSEQRRAERARESRRTSPFARLFGRSSVPFLAVAATVAVGAIWFVAGPRTLGGATTAPAPATASPSSPAVATAPPTRASALAAPREGMITLLAGRPTLDGRPLTIDDTLRPGARLVAEGGRVAVQLGRRTGLLLEAGASVEVVAFDSRSIELAVTGVVSVEVEHREPNQRFAITAAGRRVEVRGTVFRVAETRGVLDVAVTRGRVAVLDGDDSVEIPAGSQLRLLAGQRPRGAFLAALPEVEAASLADVGRVAVLPVWPVEDASSARLRTGVLAVAAPPKVRVRVDGVDAGAGSGRFQLRTVPGRHLVEVGVKGRWVEVGGDAAAVVDFAGESVSSGSLRPRQLDGELEAQRASLEGCGDRLRKVDPLFHGDIVVELGIHADGSVDFVTAVKGLADREVEACVLGVVRDRFTFPAGDAATLRKRISF